MFRVLTYRMITNPFFAGLLTSWNQISSAVQRYWSVFNIKAHNWLPLINNKKLSWASQQQVQYSKQNCAVLVHWHKTVCVKYKWIPFSKSFCCHNGNKRQYFFLWLFCSNTCKMDFTIVFSPLFLALYIGLSILLSSTFRRNLWSMPQNVYLYSCIHLSRLLLKKLEMSGSG